MKRFFLFLFAITFITVNAQIKFGVKTGINVSSLYGDLYSIDAKAGVYAGVYVQFPVSDRVSIQPEVLYSMQGAETNDDWNRYGYYRNRYKEKYELDYITIPVMFQYRIINGLRAEIGPQVSFAVYKKHKVRYRDYNPDTNFISKDEDLKSFDVGVSSGVNYELPNGINFTARYTIGFINVNDSDSNYNYDYDIRNQVLSLGVGYSF